MNGRNLLPRPRPSTFSFNPSAPRMDNRPVCQECHKPGHTVLNYYHRFNKTYQSPSPASLTANFTTLASSPYPTTTWFLDTAASHHFIADLQNLNWGSSTYQGHEQVSINDGSSLPIHHVGSAQLDSNTGKFLLNQLLHVPSISHNLLSVRQFYCDNSVFFEFHFSLFFVKDSCTQEILLQGHIEDGLYVLRFDEEPLYVSPQAFLGTHTTTQLWHSSLGHPSPRMTSLSHDLPHTSSVSSSTKYLYSIATLFCLFVDQSTCPSSPFLPTRSSFPFQFLFLDVWDFASILSTMGSCYFLSIVDDYSKFIWFFCMQSKSNVTTLVIAFLKFVHNIFSFKIVSVQTNGGDKFQPFYSVFQSFGISHRLTFPYSHQ